MNKENKKFIIETSFLKESLKHNLTLKEFVVLMYFDNEYDYAFDVKKVAKATCLNEEDVLYSFGTLLDKKLIILNSVKDEKSGKYVDKVSLDNFYKQIKDNENKKKDEDIKKDFFDEFQKGYNHGLSALDYEIINAWLAGGFSKELILAALKEANYNGVLSLRYMDKILYEWKKKGINLPEDIEKHIKSKTNEEYTNYDTEIMGYNWLDEEY